MLVSMERIDLNFPRLYIDEELKELSINYDVETCPKEMVPSSIGYTELEVTAKDFLGLSKFCGKFVGAEINELAEYLDSRGDYSRGNSVGDLRELRLKEFLRKEELGDLEILFPTEKLLESQKIRKRD